MGEHVLHNRDPKYWRFSVKLRHEVDRGYVKWYWSFVNLKSKWSVMKSKHLCFLLSFDRPFVPVVDGTDRGRVRISKIMGLWSHGIMKWVPSPITSGLTPWKRSKITARWPPSTKRDKREFRSIVVLWKTDRCTASNWRHHQQWLSQCRLFL